MPAPSALNELFHEEIYSFNSPLVVVLSQPWEAYHTEDQLLLQKILASVKVDISTVHILTRPILSLGELQRLQPGKVLIFGGEVAEDIPFYSETAAHGFSVIRAEDLAQLDEQKKKSL